MACLGEGRGSGRCRCRGRCTTLFTPPDDFRAQTKHTTKHTTTQLKTYKQNTAATAVHKQHRFNKTTNRHATNKTAAKAAHNTAQIHTKTNRHTTNRHHGDGGAQRNTTQPKMTNRLTTNKAPIQQRRIGRGRDRLQKQIVTILHTILTAAPQTLDLQDFSASWVERTGHEKQNRRPRIILQG